MNISKTLVLLLCSLFFLSSCTATQSTVKEPLTIGVDVFPGWAHVFIAQEKGLFTNNGVEVELVLHEDYLTVQEQFLNGETHGAFMVYADAIIAQNQDVPVKVVYISDQSIEGDVLAAQPEYEHIKDLRGKTIGVEGINSFSHLFVLTVLEKYGMGEGDVFFENIGAQDVVSALESNTIVAGHTYGPAKFQAMEQGYSFLAYAGEVPGIITDVLAFDAATIQERPEDIAEVVKSLFEAKEFQETNREEALMIMAQSLGDTSESVAIGIDSVDHLDIEENKYAMWEQIKEEGKEEWSLVESGELIGEFFLNRGQLSTLPDLDELIDDTFVNGIEPNEE